MAPHPLNIYALENDKMTEAEILEYISKPPVKWVELFKNHYVPEHIILEHKQKIFKGDSADSRAYEIVKMFTKYKTTISEELFCILMEHTNADISKIFDIISWVRNNPEHNYSSTAMLLVCMKDPNSYVDIFELYKDSLSLSEIACYGSAFNKDYVYNDEIHEIFRYISLKSVAESRTCSEFVFNFITVTEYFDAHKHETKKFILQQFVHLQNRITEVELDYIVDFVHTNFDGADKNPAQILDSKHYSVPMIGMFKEHEEFEYIKDMFTLPEDKLDESDYDELANKIMNDELNNCEIFSIIDSENVPFSFLKKIQPKLIQMLLVRGCYPY